MSRKLAILSLAVWLAAVASPAGAITNGEIDADNEYPYVGMATDFESYCSGSAISPTVFVTAAHCFQGPEGGGQPVEVVVSFAVDALSAVEAGDGISGLWVPEPGYCAECGNDLAVVVLHEPVDLPRYGHLPTEGVVDGLAHKSALTQVGYGVYGFARGGGVPVELFDGVRRVTSGQLFATPSNGSDLLLKFSGTPSQNPAQDTGATCFGDSGGPNLLADSDIILGVNSYGTNWECAGPSYSTRIDVEYALDFIEAFL